MKKILIFSLLICTVVVLSACRNKTDGKNNTTPQGEISQTVTPTVTQEVSDAPTVTNTAGEQESTITAYFPFRESKQYIYEGEGNEYASFWSYADYEDKDSGRIQLRTDNGGTETVQVIEINGSTLSVIVSKEEFYYRDNLLGINSTDEPEILLKEPLQKGTEWTLTDGRKRYISDMSKEISTPYGDYKTIEVTTEEQDGSSKDYYAEGIGLLKRVYTAGGMEVTSSLKEIKDTAITQSITLYYPDADENVLEDRKTLSFHTNDITRLKMQELLRAKHEGSQGLISTETNLNTLYKGNDDIVYADFSGELVSDMNAGAGFEAMTLQAITDTLGRYYGAEEVYLTVNQKPYESGHIMFKEGETQKVSR